MEQVLSLVPQSKGSRIARIVETSNVQPHAVRICICLNNPLNQCVLARGYNKGCVQYTHWGVRCLVLDYSIEFARFLDCQNQSAVTPLICMRPHISAPPYSRKNRRHNCLDDSKVLIISYTLYKIHKKVLFSRFFLTIKAIIPIKSGAF